MLSSSKQAASKSKRVGSLFVVLIMLAFCFLMDIQCKSPPTPAPEGWSVSSYKLTEHPEAFVSEDITFDEARGELTINDDTRQGFFTHMGELVFEVDLPVNGKIRFAYGYEGDTGQYRNEEYLRLAIGDTEYWSSRDKTISEKKASEGEPGWQEVELDIAKDIAGHGKLRFFPEPPSNSNTPLQIFLAHPTVALPPSRVDRARIIWISIDSLRADHLGCYGYERNTSPNIDEFAKEGCLFERCISVCPWTFPSYASMFTGRYPSITGATADIWYLPKSERTLAQMISELDYATFCASNIIWITPDTGLNRGFDTLKWFPFEYADVSLNHAKEWLNTHADENVFMFIHLVEPHVPYRPKEKFRDTFDPGYDGRFKYDFENFNDVWTGDMTLSDKEKEHLEALYDEDILSVDADIGDFFDYLKENDFYKNSLIIINSDHGEEFWEHGGFEHGHALYDEVLHVPFIIRGPGYFELGMRVKGMCATIDIFPTILDWAMIEIPDDINARLLDSLIDGEFEEEKRMLISDQLYHGTEQKGVSTDRYRYILHTIDRTEELYDLSDDLLMLRNVSPDRRAKSRDFRYFATEYMLNESSGWHVRFFRNPESKVGWRYEGTIHAASGFAFVDETRLGEDDILVLDENILSFSIDVSPWQNKGFDFSTNDEEGDVVFSITADEADHADALVFLGPGKVPAESSNFSISILDATFGLGQPVFGPIGTDLPTGCFIWGNSETLREKASPEIDERVREELKSLGYLQ